MEIDGRGKPPGGGEKHLAGIAVRAGRAVRGQAGRHGHQGTDLAREEQAAQQHAGQYAAGQIVRPHHDPYRRQHHDRRLPGVRSQVGK
ncbi:hypothetical protein D3C72_2365030 [compost metagenome]